MDVGSARKNPEEKDFPLRCDTGRKYHRKVYTNNGRTATVYAFRHGMKLTRNDVVLIPEYNCVSIVNAMEAAGVSFEFYRVKKDLVIDLDDLRAKITEKTKAVYIIHYFGAAQPKEVADGLLSLAARYGLFLVEDLTQALLTREPGRIGFGNYLVASTRKWYPMTDGGLAAARDGAAFEIAELGDACDEAVYRQMLVSAARLSLQGNVLPGRISEYLKLEKEANRARYLDFTPRAMTELSQRIFFGCDHSQSIRKRRENYTCLYDSLTGLQGLTVFGQPLDREEKQVPFGFQVMVENREEFYRYLAERGIIGEIQWILPTQYYAPSEYAMHLSEHSLMLQCDQRYGPAEMERVSQVIKTYLKMVGS